MRPYPIRSKKWMMNLFPNLIWEVKKEDAVVLTFDDGPHPEITIEVLDMLDKYEAKAIFFLVGEQAQKYPDIVKEIRSRGHRVGGHSYHHLNQWKNRNTLYIQDVEQGQKVINTKLFRPPYGKITPMMSRNLLRSKYVDQIIMWSLLSGDFDTHISPQECFKNVSQNIRPGDILLFHDSQKAYKNMIYSLGKTLDLLQEKKLKTTTQL